MSESACGMTFAFSTLAQLGAVGTNQEFCAASANALSAGLTSLSREVVFGSTPALVTRAVELAVLVDAAIQSVAALAALLLAVAAGWAAFFWGVGAGGAPPRKAGIDEPGLVREGIEYEPSFSFGLPVFGSRMLPRSQPLPYRAATLPCAKTASCLASSPSTSAREYVLTKFFHAVIASTDGCSESVDVHWSPFCLAIWPPLS